MGRRQGLETFVAAQISCIDTLKDGFIRILMSLIERDQFTRSRVFLTAVKRPARRTNFQTGGRGPESGGYWSSVSLIEGTMMQRSG
jgi:hypothetical protein